ncbi:MAG: class II fumarate hydratase [Bacteroidales bacterium]|jgi:fumarate hydratase class II|nr:class II fumarate hydratase [Bacteroidales bacterium]
MKTRTAHDSLGTIEIPADKYWGAVTQRSLEHFKIGNHPMPKSIIKALALIKKAAAQVNLEENKLTEQQSQLIQIVCDEIISGALDAHFPLSVWQTGSGTHTNMNINEVISNRGQVLSKKSILSKQLILHPNDHVNKSQSSNDVFPSAIHIALAQQIKQKVLPALVGLRDMLSEKSKLYHNIIKTGRTHMMDAVPLRLGDEFSAYAKQIDWGIKSIEQSLIHLMEIPLGGTAVGTGLNASKDFGAKAIEQISNATGIPFQPAENRFESMSAKTAVLSVQQAFAQVATDLFKITNDIRMMASGPRTGLGELILPSKEPGSSIMPGKINPTQIEAVQMACTRIISHNTGNSIANMNGHFQLNTFMPLLAANTLESGQLLGDISRSFTEHNLKEIKPNKHKIEMHLNKSLMLITALAKTIGYEKAAKIAQHAHENELSLREAAIQYGKIDPLDFDRIVDVNKMV